MGSRGPNPKHPSVRARTNKIPSQEIRQLETVSEAKKRKVPPMPKRAGARKWSEEVKEWWASIWQSPMAVMWLDSDVKGILVHLCSLHQFAHEAKTAQQLLPLLAAITKQESRLGVSPSDRKRLLWEVPEDREVGDEPEEGRHAEPEAVAPATDPRQALQVHRGGLDKKAGGAD